MLFNDLKKKDPSFLHLVRSAIVVDTVNLDPSRKKATPKDEAMLNKVEAALGEGETKRESRATLLLRLSGAKGDVSGFSTAMLMRKDMKVNRFPSIIEILFFFSLGLDCFPGRLHFQGKEGFRVHGASLLLPEAARARQPAGGRQVIFFYF